MVGLSLSAADERLCQNQLNAQVEGRLMELTRQRIAAIPRTVSHAAIARTGIHGSDGPVTLEQVLTKAVTHPRHHLKFIEEKRRALQASG